MYLNNIILILNQNNSITSIHCQQAPVIFDSNDDLAGRKLDEIMPASIFEKYEEAAEQVRASGQTNSVKFKFGKNNSTTREYVMVLGLFKDQGEIIANIVDITDSVKMESELRELKKCHGIIYEKTPPAIFEFSNELHVVNCNTGFIDFLNSTREKVIGFDIKDYEDQRVIPTLRETLHGKEGFYEGCYAPTEDQIEKWVLMSTTPLFNSVGEIRGGIGFLEDITKQKMLEKRLKKINRAYKAITKCDQVLIHTQDKEKLAYQICKILQNICNYVLVWIGLVQHDEDKSIDPIAQVGFDEKYLKSVKISWADDKYSQGPSGRVVRTKSFAINRDTQNNPNYKTWRDQALKYGYKSSAAFPMLTTDNKVMGVLNLYSSNIDAFSDEEINLMTELASDIAFGLEIMKIKKERDKAERDLRKRERQYRTIVEDSNEAILVSRKNNIIYFNKAFTRLTGYNRNELKSQCFEELLLEDPEYFFQQLDGNIMNSGTSKAEIKMKKKSGEEITVEAISNYIEYIGEPSNLIILRDITERKKIFKKLQKTQNQVDKLGTFVTICSSCKRIMEKDKKKHNWVEPELYISERLKDIRFSHGICRRCIKKLYPEQYDKFEESDFQ